MLVVDGERAHFECDHCDVKGVSFGVVDRVLNDSLFHVATALMTGMTVVGGVTLCAEHAAKVAS